MVRKNMICIMKKMSLQMLDDYSFKFIIDGKDIKTKDDFLNIMSKHFDFPKFENVSSVNLDGFVDFMTDLFWLDLKYGKFDDKLGDFDYSYGKFDNICLVIKNYNKLFNGNIEDIYFYIIEIFSQDILSFWDEEVFELNKDINEFKKFNVYLVEELIQ